MLPIVSRHGSLCHRDDREAGTSRLSLEDRVRHRLDFERDLRKQDGIGSAGEPCTECEPAGVVAHDLGDHDPVMRVGGRVEAVDRVGGDPHGCVVPERRVGTPDVVVDRLREGDDRNADLVEAIGVLHGAPAAETNDRREVVLFDDSLDHRSHVDSLAVPDIHFVHLDPAGPQNRPTP